MEMVNIALTLGSCFEAFMWERLNITRLRRFDAYHKAKTRTSTSAAAHRVAHVRRRLRQPRVSGFDVSLHGAKLVAEIGVEIGSRFRLSTVPHALVRQRCEVVWRRGKMFGAMFIG
jgi:hypothetical protein